MARQRKLGVLRLATIVCLLVFLSAGCSAHWQERSFMSDSENDDTGLGLAENSKNGSTQHDACPQGKSTWKGYLFTVIAVSMFGTCYLATKQVDVGDGMFYQWIFCSSLIVTGVIVNAIKNWPPFQPLALITGMCFATGNVTVVPIVKLIGVGMGMLVWGMVDLLIGWASARYGIIGVNAEPPCSDLLNYLGIVFCILALLSYLFVKSDGSRKRPAAVNLDGEQKPLLSSATTNIHHNDITGESPAVAEQSWVDSLSPNMRRVFGYGLATFAGLNYGLMFNPTTHLTQTAPVRNSTDDTAGLDYAFSVFTGAYLTATFYLVIYAIYLRSMPRLYPKAVLPGLLSGFMWSIGCSSWLIANDLLSQAIAFPIMTTGPAIIASLFGIILYKEITGKRNLGFFGLAFTFTLTGVTLSGLSKKYVT